MEINTILDLMNLGPSEHLYEAVDSIYEMEYGPEAEAKIVIITSYLIERLMNDVDWLVEYTSAFGDPNIHHVVMGSVATNIHLATAEARIFSKIDLSNVRIPPTITSLSGLSHICNCIKVLESRITQETEPCAKYPKWKSQIQGERARRITKRMMSGCSTSPVHRLMTEKIVVRRDIEFFDLCGVLTPMSCQSLKYLCDEKSESFDMLIEEVREYHNNHDTAATLTSDPSLKLTYEFAEIPSIWKDIVGSGMLRIGK